MNKMLYLLVLIGYGLMARSNDSVVDMDAPCSVHTINGLCLTQIEFMKDKCPDYCEDFSSSKYKCIDDPDIDCDAVKSTGLCDDNSKSMFVDNKCPVTCRKCPKHVLGASSPIVTLPFDSSSFSTHEYPEVDPAILEANHEASIQHEMNIDSDLVADLRSSLESVVESVQVIEGLTSVDINTEGDVALRTCTDTHESCSGRATHGDCDIYPKWMHQNCAKSCKDCDGKRSAAVLARTAHFLRDSDGSGCIDHYPDCVERAMAGDCDQFDSTYMFKGCRRSCRKCTPSVVDPEVEALHEILRVRKQRHEEYQRRIQAEIPTTYKPPLPNDSDGNSCRDTSMNCGELIAHHGCDHEDHQRYMYVECAKSCGTCDYLDKKKRCTRKFLNISEAPAFGPGEMGQMFRNLKLKFGHRFNITYLSTSPWVVTIDNFISDAEIAAMRRGVPKWYDIQSDEYSKEYDRVVGEGRSGTIGWCFGDCFTASSAAINRLRELTSVPINNIENFQMLEYSRSFDRYIVHHDYNYEDVTTPAGNRIFTFFMYLSDVEEGGETEFPTLGIKVKPKKGRAAMWVDALDSDPFKKDIRTDHQGNPPIKGIKYGANAGVHMYDFRTTMKWHCTWGGEKPSK